MSVLMIDMKGAPALISAAQTIAHANGVDFKFFSISERPGRSAWNPVAHGDQTENKDRIIDGYDWSEPIYQQIAEEVVQRVLMVIHRLGLVPTLPQIQRLIDPARLAKALDDPRFDHSEHHYLSADDIKRWIKDCKSDETTMKGWRGMASKLTVLLDSPCGAMFNPKAPSASTIDLYDDLSKPGIVVFSLDPGKYSVVAERIAAYVAREVEIVASRRREHDIATIQPTLMIVDEFPSATAAVTQIADNFQASRDAKITVALSCQSFAQLDALDDRKSVATITSGSQIRISGRDNVAAEALSNLCGTKQGWEPTIQTTAIGDGFDPIGVGATGTGSFRRVDEYRVHPNVFRNLPNHHVVVDITSQRPDTPKPPTVRLVPHADHPTAPIPPVPELVADTDPVVGRGRFGREFDRLRDSAASAATVGGLVSLVAVPWMLLTDDDTAPVAPVPYALAATNPAANAAGDVVVAEVGRAVIDAWLTPAGGERDVLLGQYTTELVSAAPIAAVGEPAIIATALVGENQWVLTASIATVEGATGWEFGLFGSGDVWTLTTPPTPTTPPARAFPPDPPAWSRDPVLTAELAPLLTDTIHAWGTGGNGDPERLATVTAAGVSLRPLGGHDAETIAVEVFTTTGVTNPTTATAVIDVEWDTTGRAVYVAGLTNTSGRWLVASLRAAPFSVHPNHPDQKEN